MYNKLIKSQEELDSYIRDIDNGKIFGHRYSYRGDWTANSFPCVLGLYLDDMDYTMSYFGAAIGVIVYPSDFED